MRQVILFSLTILILLALWIPAGAQTIVATYEIHDHASGLAYDGQNIWYGRYGTDGEWFYQFDIALEQIVDSLDMGATNVDDAFGLTWDGQYFWVCTHVGVDFTLQFDTAGNIISSFQNPSDYMSGLAWDGQDLWMGDYYNPDGAILKVTTSGTVLESWTAPDNQPWDLAWDGQYLWMADYYGNTVYQIDPVTHDVVYSFASPGSNPAGIAWDGQYIWLCDEGQGYSIDHLYKIDPFGAGTPEVQLSFDAYDFGYIPIGMSPYATLVISNVGDADLTVSDLPIEQFIGSFWIDPAVTLPFTITQGSSANVDVYFGPLNFGPVTGLLHVQSDDPINPDVTVDLDGYGIYPEQTVNVNTTSINYGSVWVGAGDGMTGAQFEIYNHGAAPLELISLTIDNAVFSIWEFTPGALASMDTLEVTVYFTPEAAIPYSGTMTLTTDDPDTPTVDVALSGSGTTAAFGTGDIIWQYQVTGASYFDGFNSIKYMDDINGDGIPEAIAANDDYNVYCINGQSAGMADVFYTFDTGWDPLHTGNVEYERGMVSAPDLNNDGTGDFVIGTTGGSESIFGVSGADGAQLWQFDTNNYGGDGGWVYEVTCEDDWNLDGTDDVLAAVGGPQSSSEPKSVFLIDGINGNLIWRSHLEQTVYSVRKLGHLNWDMYPEVVCGTSPYSGTYYVKCLNGWDGMVLWTTQVDNVVFSLNTIPDVNGDGLPDVAVAAAFGGVYCLSGYNGDVIWHNASTGINYYLEGTGDLNGNGYDDVLVTSVSGTFYAYEGLNGSTIWSQPFGSNVLSLAATPDVTGDGIMDACCGIMSGTFFAVDGSNGSVLFSYTHGTSSDYAFDAVGWLPDIDGNGGIEFLGGTRDGHLYCFGGGAMAMPQIGITLTPYGTPIQIPANGGSFDFNVAVGNNEPVPVTFDAWIMATLPGGTQVGPLLGPAELTMDAGLSINRDRTQFVPDFAPPGTYLYEAYVGQYPDMIYDEDSFSFEKLGTAAGGETVSEWFNEGEPFDELVDAGEIDLPVAFRLLGVYPNPFNPSTVISYQLPMNSLVNLAVYDIAGRQVAELVDGWRDAGTHEVTFDGSGLASGMYFYRLKLSGTSSCPGHPEIIGKMVLVK